MQKNKVILGLVVLNLLVVGGIATKAVIAFRNAHAAATKDDDAVVARYASRKILKESDERRILEIARRVGVRGAVSDAELEELLSMPDRNLGGIPAARDLATMSMFGALVKAKTFTPSQTARLVPFVRARLDEAERAPLGGMVATRFAVILNDRASLDKVRELTKSSLPPLASAARFALKKAEARAGG